MSKGSRSNEVRCADIPQRPGIVQPMIVPTRLDLQNRVMQTKTPVDILPDGKTAVDGVQWLYKTLRPGIAAPIIVARQDANLAAKSVDKKLATGAIAPMTPSKGMGSWGGRRRR